MPDLSGPVDFIVLFSDTLDFTVQHQVPFGAIRRQVWVLGDRYMHKKYGLGDWQNLANRLDTQVFAMLFYEGNHLLKGQASCACAKYADAFLRISFAWRRSGISRSIALI